MKVAIVGEYGTPEYERNLAIVKLLMPEEQLVDIGKLSAKNWHKHIEKRTEAMDGCVMVINICENWKEEKHHDLQIDLSIADSQLHKDMKQLRDGRLVPFAENYTL